MIVNLTPHVLNIVRSDDLNDIDVVAPSGEVARVSERRVLAGKVEGIPFYRVEAGEVEGLPDISEDTLVVSAVVAKKVRRPDVFSPGELVRDESGRVVGCLGLTTYC